MIKFVKVEPDDLPVLRSWIDADDWHQNRDTPEWWFHGYLSFKLTDPEGVVVFVRLDREGDWLRLHTQFAPPDTVNEKRVARAIMDGVTRFIPQAKVDGIVGMVTESVSPKLVAFLCNHLGFEPATGNDYKLTFSEGK